MNDYEKRLVGSIGARRVRPAKTGGANLIAINEGTYIDISDASDHSGSASLYGTTNDNSSNLKRVVLKFSQPVRLFNGIPFLILGGWQASAAVSNWDGIGPSRIWQDLVAYPITNWNGLDVDTLTWANQGTLSLASGISKGNDYVVDVAATAESPSPPTYLSSFDGDASGEATQFTPLSDILALGIIFYHVLYWDNVFESMAGGIVTDFDMVNPSTNPYKILNKFQVE